MARQEAGIGDWKPGECRNDPRDTFEKKSKAPPSKTEGTQSPRKVDVRATRPVICFIRGVRWGWSKLIRSS